MKELPAGCGYQGYEFGANYPDSECFGGQLYNMDDCDGEGMIYQPSDYIPCPMCHPKKAEKYWFEYWRGTDDETDAEIMKRAKALVADIRNNRKNGTEPWKS